MAPVQIFNHKPFRREQAFPVILTSMSVIPSSGARMDSPAAGGTPRISLVVCTYNRADILPRCLQAARAQTLAAGEYEIIVVDNASVDNTRALVEQWPE